MILTLGLTAAFAGEAAERHAFERTIAEATAEVKLYDGWYTALLLRGTLMTEAVRSAQAARLHHLTDGAAAAQAAPEGLEVWLSASTQFPTELALAGDGSTPWTISLYAGSSACAPPTEVVEVKKPTAQDRTLFPHFTSWDRVFVARWPAGACHGDPDSLRVHGQRGQGALVWR